MSCLFQFKEESKHKSPENGDKNNDYCHLMLSEEGNKILKYNKDKKYLKTLFVIYADTEFLHEKIASCVISQKNLPQQK